MNIGNKFRDLQNSLNEKENENDKNSISNSNSTNERNFKDNRFNNLAKKLNSLVDKSISNNNKSFRKGSFTITGDSKIYYETKLKLIVMKI